MSKNNDFPAALAALKDGKAVRLAGWAEGLTISLSSGPEPKLLVSGGGEAAGLDEDDSPRGKVRFFTVDAVLAANWEIPD